MRLINFGLGEISDRLSILALKLLFGEAKGQDCTTFQTERTALLQQIRSRTPNGKWFEAYTDLAAVNAALWHAEDDLRNLRTIQDKPEIQGTLARLAVGIQELNDRRATLVQQINKESGDGEHKEKING